MQNWENLGIFVLYGGFDFLVLYGGFCFLGLMLVGVGSNDDDLRLFQFNDDDPEIISV